MWGHVASTPGGLEHNISLRDRKYVKLARIADCVSCAHKKMKGKSS